MSCMSKLIIPGEAEVPTLHTLSITPVHADNHPGPAKPGAMDSQAESNDVLHRMWLWLRCKTLQQNEHPHLYISIKQGSHVLVRLTDCRSLTMKLRKQKAVPQSMPGA